MTRTTHVSNDDGSISRIINIGVPPDHPLADTTSPAGNSGLHNLRLGPIRLPVAPTFVIRIMRTMSFVPPTAAPNSENDMNPVVRIGTNDPTP